MPELNLNGRTLYYREAGSGHPLVLLHAFPLTSELFEPQLKGLSTRWRIIAPDFPGFGQSKLSSHDPLPTSSMEVLALDVLALLEVLGLDRVMLGGVSMGGYVAQSLLRIDPSRVAGLILMNTHARPDDEAGKQGREKTAQEVLEGGMEVLVKSMVPRLLAPSAPAALREQVTGLIRSNSPAGAAAASRGMALRPDGREILSRWAGPTLVVSGELDAIVPKERIDELAQLCSGAEQVRVPGVGHLACLEAPDAVNAALTQFLAAHASARAP